MGITTTARCGLAPTRTVLDNGTVILAKQSRTSPAVTISAACRAGNIYDPPELLGLGHFVSRVIDRGTTTHSGEAIAEELDSRGVLLDVRSTRHATTLSCTCLADDFRAILTLVGDIVMRPTCPPNDIETRRGEIVTALRQDEDNPAVCAVEGFFAQLYPDGHPYGRKAKGTLASINRIDRTDIQTFHRERFGPSALSLAIVGDVAVERGVEIARQVFGDWSHQPAESSPLPPAPRPRPRSQLVIPMMNKAQTDIAYGFTTIARHDARYYALTLVNTILGQYGIGGRLGQSIRERQGMAYYVFSSFDPNVIEGPLMIRAGVAPANVERAVESIDAEIRGMATDGVSSSELEDAKLFLIGSLPRALETNAGIAVFLQTAEFFGLGLDHDVQLPELFSDVTLEHANETARDLLAPERAAVVVAGPYEPVK